jgi:beta-galactosidase/beta-glucuronidase
VEGPSRGGSRLRLFIRGGEEELEIGTDSSGLAQARFSHSRPRPWSSEDPHLYVVGATLTSNDGRDEVSIPTGLRRIEVTHDEIRLNGRRLYLRGVLDQGYWPDCGLSAPSPEALRRDLELARASGYNLVRKHLKFEDPAGSTWLTPWACLYGKNRRVRAGC